MPAAAAAATHTRDQVAEASGFVWVHTSPPPPQRAGMHTLQTSAALRYYTTLRP